MATIQFFSIAKFAQRAGKIDSDLASARYRVIIPASELSRRGHKTEIRRAPPDPQGRIDIASISADVIVLSKSISVHNEALVKDLRARGVRVILDLCDSYFDHVAYGTRFQAHTIEMCKLVNNVVVSTPALQDEVRRYTGMEPTIIVDPVEGTRGQPHFAPQLPRLKLLWFGHPDNWDAMAAEVSSLAGVGDQWPLEVSVVTRPLPEIEKAIEDFNAAYAPRLSLALTPWSSDAVWSALANCDLVVIPTLKTPFYAAKSANRLTESVWAGRAVVAHPLPSYCEYADYAFLSDDIAHGIRQALESGTATQTRITQGQDYINRINSPVAIGAAWEQVMGLTSR